MSASGLSAEQGRRLAGALDYLKEQSEAAAVLITDSGGNILADSGRLRGPDLQTIAALGAGSFSATRELAARVGEARFRAVFHQGEHTSIYIQSMATDYRIIVIFGKGTPAGLVRLYVRKAAAEIEPLLREVAGQGAAEAGETGHTFEIDPSAALFGEHPDSPERG